MHTFFSLLFLLSLLLFVLTLIKPAWGSLGIFKCRICGAIFWLVVTAISVFGYLQTRPVALIISEGSKDVTIEVVQENTPTINATSVNAIKDASNVEQSLGSAAKKLEDDVVQLYSEAKNATLEELNKAKNSSSAKDLEQAGQYVEQAANATAKAVSSAVDTADKKATPVINSAEKSGQEALTKTEQIEQSAATTLENTAGAIISTGQEIVQSITELASGNSTDRNATEPAKQQNSTKK